MNGAVLNAAKRSGRRAPRRTVVLGVILYCVLAWAVLFKVVEFGLDLANHNGPSYAERSAAGGGD